MMDLQVLWFLLIFILFTSFFFLEGFDYGVGGLMPFLTSDEEERSEILRTITPVWDGNEVWMITAGGAMFAAFPHVYATMFSAFYLALFLMLVALILRGVAFDLRGRQDTLRWKRFWDGAIAFGSIVPAFLWGVAVTDLLAGLPIDAHMVYTGGFFDLLSLYSLVGGLAFLLIFLFHGAAFLTIRLARKSLLRRCQNAALNVGSSATLLFVLLIVLTQSATDLFEKPLAVSALAAAALFFLLAMSSMKKKKGSWSFAASSLAIVATTAAFFAGLFPRLMVSSLDPAWSLTITNASSSPYTLSVMTTAAAVFVPIVLLYQGWTYYIFRKRVTAKDVQEHL